MTPNLRGAVVPVVSRFFTGNPIPFARPLSRHHGHYAAQSSGVWKPPA